MSAMKTGTLALAAAIANGLIIGSVVRGTTEPTPTAASCGPDSEYLKLARRFLGTEPSSGNDCPGENVTGISFESSATFAGKQLQLLHDVVPGGRTFGVAPPNVDY